MKRNMIELLNIDCMEYMKGLPDKAFELAIVDPPYGINKAETFGNEGNYWRQYDRKEWDRKRPDENYFNELFRVSKNQIIWGGNYFTQYLPPSMGWIVWDKGQELKMSDAELAYSSFERALRVFRLNRCYIQTWGGGIHPTEKPVKLYRWLLHNYTKPEDKILDTHLGSGSIAIAAHDMGFSLVGCEIDEDYYKAACKRFKEQTMQLKLAI